MQLKNKLILILLLSFYLGKAQFIKLFDFDRYSVSNGANALGSLISDGTYLYGMTSTGGFNNLGIIFRIKPDGSDFLKLLDFAGSSNGASPRGSLVTDGSYLYGMTSKGGSSDFGVVFKIKSDGTGYVKLFDFTGASNGKFPAGSLLYDGNYLYGMTYLGGSKDSGVVFKIKPDGLGYLKLMDFVGKSNGAFPLGDLNTDGIYLYGMTSSGGINGFGEIFKIKYDGTGFTKLIDFSGSTNGKSPFGSLIFSGAQLYGMTYQGGIKDAGVIFKINPDGTGYARLYDFDANGFLPVSTLYKDGTSLYGIARGGGYKNEGLIFKIKNDGSGYSIMHEFSGLVDGGLVNCSLISDGNFLFGMTTGGGLNANSGVIFKIGINSISGFEEITTLDNSINIFPNPSKVILNIESKIQLKNIVATLYNVLGQNVKSISFALINPSQINSINIEDLPNGIYTIKITSGDLVYSTRKIIICD